MKFTIMMPTQLTDLQIKRHAEEIRMKVSSDLSTYGSVGMEHECCVYSCMTS